MKLHLTAVLSLLTVSGSADATCMTSPYQFHSNGDTVTTRELLASGDRCFHILRTNMTHPGNVYSGFAVEQRPGHGRLMIGGAGFQYQSQAGYHGDDRYAVKICMRFPHGGRGCSVVVVEATIE